MCFNLVSAGPTLRVRRLGLAAVPVKGSRASNITVICLRASPECSHRPRLYLWRLRRLNFPAVPCTCTSPLAHCIHSGGPRVKSDVDKTGAGNSGGESGSPVLHWTVKRTLSKHTRRAERNLHKKRQKSHNVLDEKTADLGNQCDEISLWLRVVFVSVHSYVGPT